MDFPQPLAHGQLVARYKRFFADVVLDDGTAITAHCPNPGAMLGLNTPGLGVWISRSDDPRRKLPWTLELMEVDGGLVGINTIKPHVSNEEQGRTPFATRFAAVPHLPAQKHIVAKVEM